MSSLVFAISPLVAQTEVNGWVVNRDPYEEEFIEELDLEVANKTYRKLNAVIVIRDGKLLVERYYNGATRDTLHNVRSVGKTFASSALGLALRDGHIRTLDQTLDEFYELKGYQNFDSRKARVTLRHLLTMTSGFDGFDFVATSPGNEENMYPQPDWVKWALDLPMAEDCEPGERWYYFTAGVVVLGDILNRRVPGGLETYAHKHLFAPIGVSTYRWMYTPQRVVNTAGGIQMTALDFAKFGQLYKNRGEWQGQQVLPAKWVDASLEDRRDTTEDGLRYGYLWWSMTFEVDGELYDVALCSGNGGNKIFVFRDLPLVIVVNASAYGEPYMHRQVDDLMRKQVIPAVGQW